MITMDAASKNGMARTRSSDTWRRIKGISCQASEKHWELVHSVDWALIRRTSSTDGMCCTHAHRMSSMLYDDECVCMVCFAISHAENNSAHIWRSYVSGQQMWKKGHGTAKIQRLEPAFGILCLQALFYISFRSEV